MQSYNDDDDDPKPMFIQCHKPKLMKISGKELEEAWDMHSGPQADLEGVRSGS